MWWEVTYLDTDGFFTVDYFEGTRGQLMRWIYRLEQMGATDFDYRVVL